jgi:hypothetical protein
VALLPALRKWRRFVSHWLRRLARKAWTSRWSRPRHPLFDNRKTGARTMRLYDFGFVIIIAGVAAAVALVVASQVN